MNKNKHTLTHWLILVTVIIAVSVFIISMLELSRYDFRLSLLAQLSITIVFALSAFFLVKNTINLDKEQKRMMSLIEKLINKEEDEG